MAFASRQLQALLTIGLAAMVGCHPLQPFYFGEDGDLSHYLDVATQLEEPDVVVERLAEVDSAAPPLMVGAADLKDLKEWNLTLEDAIQIALANSKIIRTLGGRVGQVEGHPEALLSNPGGIASSYDVALHETNPGQSQFDRFSTGRGVEAALSDFDATFKLQSVWDDNNRPVNVRSAATSIFQRVIIQDQTRFLAELAKPNALGGRSAVRHTVTYDQNNNPTREFPSDYNIAMEFEIRQPLLQGAGAEFNRIFGLSSGQADAARSANGVLIARIGTDIALENVEIAIRDLVREVEEVYWELYYDYRNVQVQTQAVRDAAESWDELVSKSLAGGVEGAESFYVHRARGQVHAFRGQERNAQRQLLNDELRLRYLMGLAGSDGRVIVPVDEPTRAEVTFDYARVRDEALTRSPELRRQKWTVRDAEYRLVAAKNFLLPRVDFIAEYRFLGLGDDLISTKATGSRAIPAPYAWESLLDGTFQEWTLGVTADFILGQRKANLKMRNTQLGIARERDKLKEQELEISSQMQVAVRNAGGYYLSCQEAYNAMMSYEREVQVLNEREDLISNPYDKFDALLRLATARSSYYRQLVEYNKALRDVHWRKGSLLEYNNVLLAEGPWPSKAYYDAEGEARKTDASRSLNYGVTRPGVTSRGPVQQHLGSPNGGRDGGRVQPSSPRQPTPADTVPEELPPAVIDDDTAILLDPDLEFLK